MIVLNEAQAQHDLAAAALPCPSCGGQLRPVGGRPSARCGCPGWTCLVASSAARCRDCRTPRCCCRTRAPLRHADAIEVVGAALLAHAAGHGHRTIATELNRPVDTVRGWLRRVTGRPSGCASKGPCMPIKAIRCWRRSPPPAAPRWLTRLARSGRPPPPSRAGSDRSPRRDNFIAVIAVDGCSRRFAAADLRPLVAQPCPRLGDSMTSNCRQRDDGKPQSHPLRRHENDAVIVSGRGR